MAISPFLVLFNPGVQCIWPIKLNLVESSKLNFYLNFFTQATGLFYWSLVFYTSILIFFVVLFNVASELRTITKLCQTVGDDIKETLPQENGNGLKGTLSTNVLNDIQKTMKINELKEKQDKISKLLRTILKYHANVIW